MKVGLIYTGTTPELVQQVEHEVYEQLGSHVILYSQEDPSILADIRAAGYVTAIPASKLIMLYMNAVQAGCDAILNLCSSVGKVADAAQDIANFLGVPIVRVDQEMCCEAVRRGRRIVVMATLTTTLEPTKASIRRAARKLGRQVELTDCLIDGAFGLNPERFKALLLDNAMAVADEADVILLAQGSMAYCEGYLAQKLNKTVLSSPHFGACELKKALQHKGIL